MNIIADLRLKLELHIQFRILFPCLKDRRKYLY